MLRFLHVYTHNQYTHMIVTFISFIIQLFSAAKLAPGGTKNIEDRQNGLTSGGVQAIELPYVLMSCKQTF